MDDIQKNHNAAVAGIFEVITKARQSGKKLKIYHGGSNSTRNQDFRKGSIVDTSNLNNVLRVDSGEKTVTVEPNVSMKTLFEDTSKFGLMSQVVMEFPEITVGGGVAGVSGESSSFKYGGFHEGALEYEVVLGDGRVVIANRSKNSELFYALPGSYGTLGVITKAKLQLIPVKQFVRLKYIRVKSIDEAQELIVQKSKADVQFIDGIMFTKQLGVIMVGEFSDKTNLPISHFSHWWNEWFYIHVKKQILNNSEHQELVPLKDYLFRYDKGAFWAGNFVFDRLNVPFIRFNRWLASPFMNAKRLYRGLRLANISQDYLVQDYCLPSNNVKQMYEIIDKKLNIYPLWLLPLKAGDKSKLSAMPTPNADTVMNIGTYGRISWGEGDSKRINRSLERSLRSLGGRKVLYAYSYYTEQEFWDIYDKSWYDKVRNKYSANDVFPNIYSKVIVKHKYNGSMGKGVFKIFLPPYKLPLR